MVTVTHAKRTGAPADSTALVDGVAWDTAHVVSNLQASDVNGLAPSATIDTTNASNITKGTLPAAQLPSLTGSALPLMDGTASAGTSAVLSRQDHVHPTDTSRAPLASPSFTGTPSGPTPTTGDNSNKLATTQFVASTLASYETTSALAASYAPLASPALTGTPTAPTATNGTNTTQLATTAFVLANSGFSVVRSYIAGLTLSTAGSSATFSVAAGLAADSTNTYMVTLASTMSKTTSSWAAGTGNGGLDTSAVAANTWYHVHLIYKPATATVDVLFSLSATSPTLPSGYTAFRRIGAMKTNGSSQWALFVQAGDEFLWSIPVNDVNISNLGTAPTLYTLSVPTLVQVRARMRGFMFNSSTAILLINSPDEASAAANSPSGNQTAVNQTNSIGEPFGELLVRTNTSGQIRAVSSVASTQLGIATMGWFDDRGKNS